MKYKFRYFNGTFKLLSLFLVPLINTLVVLALFRVITFAIALSRIDNAINIIEYVDSVAIIVAIVYAVSYLVLPKGVFLTDKYIIIARWCVSLRNFKSIIFIKYEDIENINVNYFDLRKSKHYGSQLVPFGDECYNVELTKKNGKKYFFSIVDAENLCETLSDRIVISSVSNSEQP